MTLWKKSYDVDSEIEKFTVGNDYLLDQNLVNYDCIASIAHAKMLCEMKILSLEECNSIVDCLNAIIALNDSGNFKINPKDEDGHTAIENYLVEKLGDTGKKIHTARSRNDQVLAALRLYYKAEIKNILILSKELNASIVGFEKKYGKSGKILIPGFTHTRKAMPSSVSMWAEAFTESLDDNDSSLNNSLCLIDQNPLGTGAGYGFPESVLKVDREMTTKLLGFSKVQKSPIYVQNSRGKFEAGIVNSLSLYLYDLSKISSDLILFSMPEFGYFELPKEICTGSSIMPQKHNPDVLELVRAKYSEILALEFQLKNISAGLISGYHRDLQLTKEPIMKAFEITKQCLSIMKLVFDKLSIDEKKCKEAMTEELFAAERAYKLVQKGMPFRDAYKEVSKEFEKK